MLLAAFPVLVACGTSSQMPLSLTHIIPAATNRGR
jgi:hypothetical protein